MFRWIPYPFVRVVVFFCTGTLIAIHAPGVIGESGAQWIFIACCSLYMLLAFTRQQTQFNPGFFGFLAILAGGYCYLLLHTQSRRADHILHIKAPAAYYTAVITKPAEEKEKSWKLEAEVSAIRLDEVWSEKTGKILLYIPKNSVSEPFRYGDVVMVKGSPQVVRGPLNPGEFDYKRFLSFKNIYHQHFVRGEDIRFIRSAPPSIFIGQALAIRQWADGTLKKYVNGKREHALASALVLGVTDGLDNDLLNAYSATGAMHVLSVSGLHVGIIYWMLLMICKPLARFKNSKWIVAAISVFVLWGYAFVTGICPSVLRAVSMFTFVAIAKPWNHRTNIYNILAASAFCLLLYDPFMIMSVGFQLSYLAVLGIVTLQPPIYRLWEPRQWYWDEIWKVSAVSIAAQLATFSLGLFYFHQFPNYFLLTNLIVIPGSFLVLVIGVGVMLISFVQPVAAGLGRVLEWIIKAINETIFFIEKLPLSQLTNIQINALQCFTLIILIAMFFLWRETKKTSWLVYASVLCCVFSAGQWSQYNKTFPVRMLTVYNVPGHTAMDFSSQGTVYTVGDSALLSDKRKTSFHVQPNRINSRAGKVMGEPPARMLFEGCMLVVWSGKTIVHMKSNLSRIPDDVKVDYLVVSNDALKDADVDWDRIHPADVILDSSNSFRHADRIVAELRNKGVRVYSVLHDGAFQSTL